MTQTTLPHRVETARIALRVGLGLAAFLAGLDKFVGLLADWPGYVAPMVAAALPVSPDVFMRVIGVVEMAVGLAILTSWTRAGAWVAMAWLLLIAGNLVLTGHFFDVAVRDVEMAIAAFALARLTEAHEAAAGAGAQRFEAAA
ncbi:MAG TPA: hypothetical protein VGR62_11925 [Candidatus Binatia bacterium]|jgi:hypothetical protein|nr:hypothetical protein [Candidatus Binatia bacterium]